MPESAFNIALQHNLSYKIALGLERIAEAYKALLWDHAKVAGISPIQLQILIFVAYHNSELCHVSYLAKEFNVTKPTISDAVKALFTKELILKNMAIQDHRRYTISLADKGRKLLQDIDQFANPLVDSIHKLDKQEQQHLYGALQKLITGLHAKGILEVQRNCFGCSFYSTDNSGQHYCTFLDKQLTTAGLRIDCPEFEAKN